MCSSLHWIAHKQASTACTPPQGHLYQGHFTFVAFITRHQGECQVNSALADATVICTIDMENEAAKISPGILKPALDPCWSMLKKRLTPSTKHVRVLYKD